MGIKHYTVINETPLRFHRFFCNIALPLRILVWLMSLVFAVLQLLENIKLFTSYEYFPYQLSFLSDVFFTLTPLCISVAAFILLPKLRWSGVVLLVISYAVSLTQSVVHVSFEVVYPSLFSGASGEAITSFILNLFLGIIVLIYYLKRRLLFVPLPFNNAHQNEITVPSTNIPTTNQTTEESLDELRSTLIPSIRSLGNEHSSAETSSLVDPESAELTASASEKSTSIPPPPEKEYQEPWEAPHKVYGPLDPPEPKAAGHGAHILAVTALCLTFILLIASSILGYLLYQSSQENDHLQVQLESLKQDAAQNDAIIVGLRSDVQSARASKDSLQTQYDRIYPEFSFWTNYAVIVTTTGNSYHRYGCYHLGDNPFLILNVGAAKARGYSPCLDCSPPTGIITGYSIDERIAAAKAGAQKR